tara:strand:- start:18320 stop:19582 length:1263 start_codon:yes stop_codon:yes gene_type:complete
MSGNIAGLASYNGTGTQGTAVVDSPEKEGEIMSTIWNKNDTTRQLITGTALKEITPGGIVSDTLNDTVTTFTIGSDVDVIGEMFLQFSAKTNANSTSSAFQSANFIFNLISKVEVLIGSQVWQTLSPSQLTSSSSVQDGGQGGASIYNIVTGGPGYFFNGTIPLLGMFTNTISPLNSNFIDQRNNGYLMAAAPNQDMHIKVYWANGIGIIRDNLAPLTFNANARVTITSCTMYCKQSTISNFEREQIRSMVLPKRVNMTQSVSQQVTLKKSSDGEQNYTFNVNCDPLSIYASALCIRLSKEKLVRDSIIAATTEYVPGCTVELFLNGSSYSGPINGEFLAYYGGVLLGCYVDDQTIIFPLANSINGSGVPLNRFDSIRVVIKLQKARFLNTIETQDSLSVTAIGESTILYSGGAASLNKF